MMMKRSFNLLALCPWALGLVLSLWLVGSALAQPASGAAGAAAASKGPFREITWEDLMPKGWDPYKGMRDNNTSRLVDGDPRAALLMRDIRQILDTAPTVGALDGQAVKLPGYVVPLDESKNGLKEFLLVPYFGACIHTPPPPANQIVHVIAAKPVKGFRAMDTVWVSGTLATTRQESSMGTSGYTLNAWVVDRYVPPARP
jgi:hypothetical protein